MEYRLLGPLEVLDASGQKIPLGGVMQQSVLVALLLRAGQTVALDRLVDELWEEPPATALKTAQVYVSRLRQMLPDGAIESSPGGGYALILDGDELDLNTFERWAEEGHVALATGEWEQASSLLREALAVWRGPALAGLTSEALRREAEWLEERRLSVLEDRIEADLGSARHGEIVPELKALVAEHPLREHLRAQLMRALYRSGRPGEALALYRENRRFLIDELGMEPGQELRELEQAILRQDAELEAPTLKRSVAQAEPLAQEPGTPLAHAVPREVRKTVTVLFCDVVGSTAVGESTEPEVLRALLVRYFERMKTIVERHSGTVEKFIGDAVMAVFGVPVLHEDDALRAVRSAVEMRDALPDLGLGGRIGVMTGEVVTGTEERLATGDAVNVAARLEKAAQPGEVLIGAPTVALVGGAVDVQAVEPLALKGKAEPVAAFRLLGVHEPADRRPEARFVGRERELAAIQAAWERALAERCCELVTIVGEAGIGKSRLVAEALTLIEARVVRGRCLPYGEGITYWPVIEAIKQLDALPSDATAAAAIRSLLGESEAATSADEIAWAFRKLLEEQAPTIVVFDDIQWGDETLLDLIEQLALLSSGSPFLLLAMARPDLVERRPTWPVTLRLEPLAEGHIGELIGTAVPGELGERIARAAGGNPLFVAEMLAMAGEADGKVVVPPTLRSLLAARLDQLDSAERDVLERAAVEGEVFHRGTVQALASEGSQLMPRLSALIRKGLVRPDRAQLLGEDGFRFRHALIRDAAYNRLPKSARAELHERLAAWLDEHGAEFAESDEIVGYHLEQSALFRADLGQPDDLLAESAAARLAAASWRARWRGDVRAATSLLERALTLTRPFRFDVHLELDLASAHWASPEVAVPIAEAAVERAREARDEAGEALAHVVAAICREDGDVEGLELLARRALPLFEHSSDHAGLFHIWHALVNVAGIRCRFEEKAHAREQMFQHARRAGHGRQGAVALDWRALVDGPWPADEALRLLDAAPPESAAPYQLLCRAHLFAMLGRFDEAWPLTHDAAERYREQTGQQADSLLADLAMLDGDHEAAVGYLRTSCDSLKNEGRHARLSTEAPRLGRELCALGRFDEAEPLAKIGRELGDEQDVATQMLWRQVQARVHAHRGEHGEAERLVREAVAIAEGTDALNSQGDALCDLAEVLDDASRPGEGAVALEQAIACYERKENVVMAERVRARLVELRRSETAAEQA